jgi:hypothetical protein
LKAKEGEKTDNLICKEEREFLWRKIKAELYS